MVSVNPFFVPSVISLCILPQDSLTMSSRQRYFVRHRKGGKTSIYLGSIAKETLETKEKYTEYAKSLVSSDGK